MSISTMTLSELVKASNDAGYHFFTESAMRMFGTKLHGDIYGAGYFVTSEQDPNGFAWDGKRRFTVRQAISLTEVRTVSEFGEFSTEVEAWASVPD